MPNVELGHKVGLVEGPRLIGEAAMHRPFQDASLRLAQGLTRTRQDQDKTSIDNRVAALSRDTWRALEGESFVSSSALGMISRILSWGGGHGVMTRPHVGGRGLCSRFSVESRRLLSSEAYIRPQGGGQARHHWRMHPYSLREVRDLSRLFVGCHTSLECLKLKLMFVLVWSARGSDGIARAVSFEPAFGDFRVSRWICLSIFVAAGTGRGLP